MLDLRARDRSQLIELLGREEDELIASLGGRRREELRRAHRDGTLTNAGARASAVCVHHRSFPRRLRAPGAPRLLYTDGDAGLLRETDNRPTVALLGTSRPSDYGVEMARSLASDLARNGVLIVAPHSDGLAWAARAGVEQAGSGAVLISGDGLNLSRTPDAGATAAPVLRRGCVAAELPPGIRGRRWARLAAERTVAHLGDLVVVVESESAHELFAVELARAIGVRIAAVPGRATSPLARGPLELLAGGAALVCCSEDVTTLLGLPDGPHPPMTGGTGLPARLARLLDRVGSGEETLDQLLTDGTRPDAVLVALAELELVGLIRRTRNGRYVAAAGA